MDKVDTERLRQLLEKWQHILRVRDWDLRLHVVKESWRKSADIKISEDTRLAILMVNSDPISDNLEELVVHELLHLKLYELDQLTEHLIKTAFGADEDDPSVELAYRSFFGALEPLVEDLTKSFLALDGHSTDELSFGYLEREVAEEVARNKPE